MNEEMQQTIQHQEEALQHLQKAQQSVLETKSKQ